MTHRAVPLLIVGVVLAGCAGTAEAEKEDASSVQQSESGATASAEEATEAVAMPIRGCATRAEGGSPPGPFARPGDLVVGPTAFSGLLRVMDPAELERYRAGSVYTVKTGLRVRAGQRITLVVGKAARSWVSLSYDGAGVAAVSDGVPSVQFRACVRTEPAFSYDGPVGAWTAFAGGFIVARRGCAPVDLWVDGRDKPLHHRISFGAGEC